ncbi:MAG TPA: HutD family protein, partial [Holophagaceae bacterium]
MRWTRTTLRDARRMPWKNGGGTTLELAVEPPGATLETGFAWRLSCAEVGASGPFSPFPGLDRTLVLLSGEGFLLDFGPHGQVHLVQALESVRFDGGWPARADLLGGPCVDLNLMADPARCRA